MYGILHDQLTYTISPEYFTKFKFYQFRLAHGGEEAIFPNPRFQVSIVGFKATWWMGILIGLILGAVGLVQEDVNRMFKVTMNAFLITMIIAFITGLIGLAYGSFVLSGKPKNYFQGWHFPDNLIDFKNYVKVGSMHNYSYLGGLIGMMGGIFYSLSMKRKKWMHR